MKKALVISIAFNVLIILFVAGKRYYYMHSANSGAGSTYDTWNYMRNTLLIDLPIDSNDIVFVGNSITEGFPVTEIFGQHVKNRGIGGNQTAHILSRIEPIAIGHPKKIFLEAGVNDLNNNVSIDSIYYNFREIINMIRELSPKTSIYVQSVFPTCKEYSKLNDVIVGLNTKLLPYCQSSGVNFINVYSALASNGELNNAYTADGIHLNGDGYKAWQKVIERYIK